MKRHIIPARLRNNVEPGEKFPKKQRRVKRETRKPPEVAPYVPPQRKNLHAKSSNKIVDIFDGMTLGELAKRTGASVSTLQGIVVNVGEKVDSEFDPISMDIAELVAMVCSSLFLLHPQVAGEAQILNVFEIRKGHSKEPETRIAGCRVVDGRITKSSTLRLLRSGELVYEGPCASLKREKQDADAVGKGNECGVVIQGCNDVRIGDVIQCVVQVNIKPRFVSSESGAVRIAC